MILMVFVLFSVLSLVLASIEKIYQTLETVFQLSSKYLEVRQKCGQLRSFVFAKCPKASLNVNQFLDEVFMTSRVIKVAQGRGYQLYPFSADYAC